MNFEEESNKLFSWYKAEVDKLFHKHKSSMHGLDGCSNECRSELKALQAELDREYGRIRKKWHKQRQ